MFILLKPDLARCHKCWLLFEAYGMHAACSARHAAIRFPRTARQGSVPNAGTRARLARLGLSRHRASPPNLSRANRHLPRRNTPAQRIRHRYCHRKRPSHSDCRNTGHRDGRRSRPSHANRGSSGNCNRHRKRASYSHCEGV